VCSTATNTAPTSSPTSSPGTPFSGRGYLNVIQSGNKKGCIISKGSWYTSGTCATITASGSADSFTLKSSKGECGISDGQLTCGSASSSTTFSTDGSTLLYDGTDTFFADAVPSGTTQSVVYTDDGHDVQLSIEWQGL